MVGCGVGDGEAAAFGTTIVINIEARAAINVHARGKWYNCLFERYLI